MAFHIPMEREKGRSVRASLYTVPTQARISVPRRCGGQISPTGPGVDWLRVLAFRSLPGSDSFHRLSKQKNVPVWWRPEHMGTNESQRYRQRRPLSTLQVEAAASRWCCKSQVQKSHGDFSKFILVSVLHKNRIGGHRFAFRRRILHKSMPPATLFTNLGGNFRGFLLFFQKVETHGTCLRRIQTQEITKSFFFKKWKFN